MKPIQQHQSEIQTNLEAWKNKTLLRSIYASFYERIQKWIDQELSGTVVEIGSGIGNLKSHCKTSICTDLFPNPWLDLVCDGYELPFAKDSISHLVLFDVFHHLEAPAAFFRMARRAMVDHGRVILFEPYISTFSYLVYGLCHHEPVAMKEAISSSTEPPHLRGYYAAQGNATRIFFHQEPGACFEDWKVLHTEAFSTWGYFLSGGYSKLALYPNRWQSMVSKADCMLSKWPETFGGRCLIILEAQ